MRSLLKHLLTLILFLVCTSLQIEAKRIVARSVEDFFMMEDNKCSTFIVKNDIDLRGSHIILPENSCLIFKRKGCLRNGLVEGSHSRIVYKEGNNIFCDCVINGKWDVKSANSLMFDNSMEALLLLKNLSILSSYVKLSANRDYNILANDDYLELETIESFGKDKPKLFFHTINPNVGGLNIVGNNVTLRNLIVVDDYVPHNDIRNGHNDIHVGSTFGLFGKKKQLVNSLLIEGCEFYGGTSSSYVASSKVKNCIVRDCTFKGYISDHAIYCSVYIETFIVQNCRISDVLESKGLFKIRSSNNIKKIALKNIEAHNINGYLGYFSLLRTPELNIELDSITVSQNEGDCYVYCGFCITDDSVDEVDNIYNAKQLVVSNCKFNYGYNGKPIVYKGSGKDAYISSIRYYNSTFCNSHFCGAVSDELLVSKCRFSSFCDSQGIFPQTQFLSICDSYFINAEPLGNSLFNVNYENKMLKKVLLNNVSFNICSDYLFYIHKKSGLQFEMNHCIVNSLTHNIFKAPTSCYIQYDINNNKIQANNSFPIVTYFN